MEWVKPEFGDFLLPPKKKQRTEDPIHLKKFEPQHLPEKLKLSQLLRYKPKSKQDLVVSKKKVDEVEQWLKNIIYESTFLLLTGPTGCGKLNTLSVLCKSLHLECIEWNSPATSTYDPENNSLYQSELDSFEEFIMRASRYSNVLCSSRKRLVVVKDLPNTFLRDNTIFQSFIEKFYGIKNVHIAFIISDGTICRNLFPELIKVKFNIKNINFNPVTQKSILIALNIIIKKFEITKINPKAVNYLNEISISCNGDLRNAITSLSFLIAKGKNSSQIPFSHKKTQKKKKTQIQGNNISSIVSDPKIDIFHGLGRVLYTKKDNNKLVHDPQEISEYFTSSPNLFVGMLHENYLHTFSSVHDVAMASKYIAISDHLLQDWNEYSMLFGCGVSVTVHGLMISNSSPIKKFQQFNKSQMKKDTLLKETKDIIESSNPNWKGKNTLLDIASYALKIPNFKSEHLSDLKKLAHFSS